MKRWWVRALLVVGFVIVIAGAAIAWRLRPRKLVLITDGETIREPAAAAVVREILWQPPTRLDQQINIPSDVYEPRISRDGLTLYFVRGRAGQNADLFTCRRTLDGWTAPHSLTGVNCEHDELGPHPSPDDQSLFFYSDRGGGLGGYDLWVTRRADDGWRPPRNLGKNVNSEFNEYGPAPSPDGKTLYFASNRPRADEHVAPRTGRWSATIREDLAHHDYDLYESVIVEGETGPAEPLTALNTTHNEGAACVSPYGDFLYFCSDRPGGIGGFDLFRARRFAGRFEQPTNLGSAVNTPANELDPALSLGGYGLYFSSDRHASQPKPDRPNEYQLYYTSSREVFRDVTVRWPTIDWPSLWRTLAPNLAWALLAILLILLLRLGLRDIHRREISLLTRCLLFSLFFHLLLMLLFNAWRVGSTLAQEISRSGPIQIALNGSTSDALAAQIRGGSAPIEPPQPAVSALAPTRPIVAPPSSPSVIEVATPKTELVPLTRAEPLRPAAEAPTEPFRARSVDSEHVDVPPLTAAPMRLPRERAPTPQADPPRPALRTDAPLARSDAWPASQPTALTKLAPDAPSEAADATLVGRADAADAPARRVQPASISVAANDASPPTLFELALPSATHGTNVTEIERSPTVAVSGMSTPRARFAPPAGPARAMSVEGFRPGTPIAAQTSIAIVSSSDAPVHASLPGVPSSAAGQPAVKGSMRFAVPLPRMEEAAPASVGEPASPIASMSPQPLGRAGGGAGVPLPGPHANVLPGPSSARGGTGDATSGGPAAESLAGSSVTDAPARTDVPAELLARVEPDARNTDPLGGALRIPTDQLTPDNPYVQRAPEERDDIVRRMGGSDQTEAAVNRALKWLAAHQSNDGRWSSTAFDDRCGECSGPAQLHADVAMTGLSVLCFLGADHTHAKEGPYRTNVRRAVHWLRKHQRPDGDLRNDESMYSHGIATIALAEAYGMTHDEQLAEPVRRAVEFIWRARSRRGAGWRYEPGQFGDTSVLGWQVMALRSAQRTGIDVPDAAFAFAQHWLDLVASRARPGLYAYQPGRSATPSMTAEGMFVLQLTGVPSDDVRMDAAAELLLRNQPDWDRGPNTYYWYYATLALFQRQGSDWPKWNRRMVRELLSHQETQGAADGSWAPEGEWAPAAGRVYQTALCTLMLEVYYRYLPMYAAVGSTAPLRPIHE